MKKLLLNQLGNGAVITMVLAGVIAAGTVGYMNSVDQNIKTLAQSKGWDKGQLMLDKVKTLANFLVSNSVIACKEGAFSNQTEGHRCEWTGHQVLGGKLTKIDMADIGLNDTGYDDKGFLEFELDTTKIKTTEKTKDDHDSSLDLTGKIAFKLYNLKNDEWNLKGKLSEVPQEYSHADKDNTFVLIKIEVADKQYAMEQKDNKDKDKDKVAKKNGAGKFIKSFVAVRRPLSYPIISLNSAKCKTSCKVASSQDNNPSCRGEQNSEGGNSEVAVPARTVNSGPGILYHLNLEKSTEFDKGFFPNLKVPAPSKVDAMPQRDYLLPGESVEWVTSVRCHTIKTRSDQTFTRSASNGSCRQNGRSVPCPSQGAQAGVTVGQHSQPAGKVKFTLDISTPGKEKMASHTIVDSKKVCEDKSYFKLKKKFKGDDPCSQINFKKYYDKKIKKYVRTFRMECPDESKFEVKCKNYSCSQCTNEFFEKTVKVNIPNHRGLSSIEPARVISDKSFDGDFPMMEESQVVIRVIATH